MTSGNQRAVGPGGANAPRFTAFNARDLDDLVRRIGLPADERLALQAVAAVLPFRTNSYVVDELIDWSVAPEDPIFRLTFPQPGMLSGPDLKRVTRLLRGNAPRPQIHEVVTEIRSRLNPHPSGQLALNTPTDNGRPVAGVQHKYRDTVLVFPRPGQECHAFCTYCFRWPQFVGEPDLRIATDDVAAVTAYLRAHPEVTDVLITGGDPLIMSAAVLSRYLRPLLAIETIQSVRIGTKALSFWPYRFVTDRDADDLLRLFAEVVERGRHLALMAHVSHPQELRPDIVRAAVARVRDTGAIIRCQGPLARTINDNADVWTTMWRELTRLGAVPYYQFVERDTGPQNYFAVPLARCYDIFRDAYARVPGLAKTVRGPVMSATPGKVCVDGIVDVNGERAFALHFIQARDPDLVGRPFFAGYDPAATWLTDLKPAFGASQFLPGLDLT